jgi:hypothetical protein
MQMRLESLKTPFYIYNEKLTCVQEEFPVRYKAAKGRTFLWNENIVHTSMYVYLSADEGKLVI